MIRVIALKMGLVFSQSSRTLIPSILSATLANTIITITQAFLLSKILIDAYQSDGDFREIQPMIYWLGSTFLLKAILAFVSEKIIYQKSCLISAGQRSEIIEKTREYGADLERKLGFEIADLAIHGVVAIKLYLSQFFPRFIYALILPISIALTITTQDFISGGLILITLSIIAIDRLLLSTLNSSNILRKSFFKISILELSTLLLIGLNLIQVAYRLNLADINQSNGLVIIILLLQIFHPLKILTISPQTQLFKVYLDGKRAENKISRILDFENNNLEAITNIGKLKELRWTDSSIKPGEDQAIGFRWGIATAGKLTVITGNDQAGKFALIHSIIRMQDLDEGRIFIEGSKDTYRVDQLDLNYWLRQIAWVSQSPIFVQTTIEENLKLIKQRANKEFLVDLLLQANLTVDELSDGLATKIGSNQDGLSQSQLQKLAIARLILKDSHIAIFDDFSTALDLENQKFFHIVLKELSRKGKIVLAISDNEDLIKLADRVIKFDSVKELVNPEGSGRENAPII